MAEAARPSAPDGHRRQVGQQRRQRARAAADSRRRASSQPDGSLQRRTRRYRAAQRHQVAAHAQRLAQVARQRAHVGARRAAHVELDASPAMRDHLERVDGHRHRGPAPPPRPRAPARRAARPSTRLAEYTGGTCCSVADERARRRARRVLAERRPRRGPSGSPVEVVGGGGEAEPHGRPVRSSRRRPGSAPGAWPCRCRAAARRWRRDRGCRCGRRGACRSARRTRSTTSWDVGPAGLSTTSTPSRRGPYSSSSSSARAGSRRRRWISSSSRATRSVASRPTSYWKVSSGVWRRRQPLAQLAPHEAGGLAQAGQGLVALRLVAQHAEADAGLAQVGGERRRG